MNCKFGAIVGLLASSLLWAASPMVVGYYPYWAQYSQFYPSNVRYNLLTNIHYGYLVPSGGSLNFADDSDVGNFKALADSARTRKVKLMVSIGGLGNEEAMKAVSGKAEAEKIADAALAFLSQYKLAGVELDWKLGSADDMSAFNSLVGAFVSAFENSDEDYLLAATVSGNADIVKNYSAEILNGLDYVTIMAIDDMSAEQSMVVPNCSGAKIADIVEMYVKQGIEPGKLVPVVPFYGKSFAGATGLGTAHNGIGSGNEGLVSYKDLMGKFEGKTYVVAYDEESESEVAVGANETIVFNGIPSVKSVAEFVSENELGGIAAFDLSNDAAQPIVSLLVTVGKVLRPNVDYKGKKK